MLQPNDRVWYKNNTTGQLEYGRVVSVDRGRVVVFLFNRGMTINVDHRLVTRSIDFQRNAIMAERTA